MHNRSKTMKILEQKHSGTAWRYKVTSESDARRHYIVLQKSPRNWQCSCMSWIVPKKFADGSRRRVNCKHIHFVAGGAA
jgi:hypothetical protein